MLLFEDFLVAHKKKDQTEHNSELKIQKHIKMIRFRNAALKKAMPAMGGGGRDRT